ncbi:MAG: hypothetical protein QW385_09230, partial [Thermoproteota archaeon]
ETAILTVALYGVMLIALNMFSVVSQWMFIDSVKVRLGEVANQVAYEIANIYTMCRQSQGNSEFFKPIEIPVAISNSGYAIELRKIEDVWYVTAYLEANRAINVSSPIWKEPDTTVHVELSEGAFTITRTHGAYTVKYGAVLHSGTSRPVVWASKSESGSETEIRVGLGKVENSGG